MLRIRESIGAALGALLTPVAAIGARLRGGRVLHPAGTVCAAELVAAAEEPALAGLSRRLAGAAIVRMSGALWRDLDAPELLGAALRLRGDRALAPEVDPRDQDLLFATMRRPWALPLAMFTTDHRDYLRNVYYTVGCLDAGELGPVELRLVPLPTAEMTSTSSTTSTSSPTSPSSTSDRSGPRGERLAAAMTAGQARLRLELRRAGERRWQILGELRLRGRLEIDEQALCYSPYQTGMELQPRGLLHAMRGPTYQAGQAARGR